jgi:hypothetical protein
MSLSVWQTPSSYFAALRAGKLEVIVVVVVVSF